MQHPMSPHTKPRKGKEKPNTESKKPSNNTEHEPLMSVWEMDDEYSPERLGLKSRSKYNKDTLYRLLTHERIVSSYQKKMNFLNGETIRNQRNVIVGLSLVTLGLLVLNILIAIGD